MIEFKCPKDQAPLRSYERNGITIERCTECGGVFLDRGELEQLITAAAGEYPSRNSDDYGRDYGRSRGEDESRYDGGDKRRRRGWLGELFDG